MKIIKNGWDFFQDQILGMHWLKDLIGKLLVKAGLGEGRFPGEFLHFFLYGKIPWYLGEYYRGIAWNGDTVLLLLIDSDLYGIHQCRIVAGSYFLVSDFISDGGSGISGSSDECLWREDRICLCDCWTCHSCYRGNDH